jgi:hypothetical protein
MLRGVGSDASTSEREARIGVQNAQSGTCPAGAIPVSFPPGNRQRTVNECPQPQLDASFGFLNLNP